MLRIPIVNSPVIHLHIRLIALVISFPHQLNILDGIARSMFPCNICFISKRVETQLKELGDKSEQKKNEVSLAV